MSPSEMDFAKDGVGTEAESPRSQASDGVRVARPPILDVVPPQGPVVIEASAGTGKTYTIERLVVDLMLTHGASLDQILVLTFTDRAASELRQRIRQMLENLLTRPELAKGDEKAWVLDNRTYDRIERELWNFDRAAIGTIHWFCRGVLEEHAFRAGRLLRQELISDRELVHGSLLEVTREMLAQPESLACSLLGVGYQEESLFWGKLEEWIRTSLDSRSLLYPVFDPERFRRAAGEFDALAEELDWPSQWESLSRHYEQFGIKGPKRKAHLDRFERWVELVLNDTDPLRWARLIRAMESDRGYLSGDGFPTKLRSDDEPALFAALAELFSASVPFQSALTQILLPPVRRLIATQKRRDGLITYDDMIGDLATLLVNDTAGLREALIAKYRFALLDEFQDTDVRQWEIIGQLFAIAQQHGDPNAIPARSERRLFVIGDPKQSIYRFRGADLDAYQRSTRTMLGGADPVPLKDCFRATSSLISSYNAIIGKKGVPSLFRADGNVHYGHPVECGRPDLRLRLNSDSSSDMPPSVVIGRVQSSATTSLPVEQVRACHGRWIAAELARILGVTAEKLRLESKEGSKEITPSDVFVLTYTNREGRTIARYLREAGVPYSFYKLEGLFGTQEARDILTLLRWLSDPEDRSATKRVLLTPFFSLSLVDVSQLGDERPALLDDLLERWSPWIADRRYDRLFPAILEETGVLLRELVRTDSERELTNYTHLFELLREEGLAESLSLPELTRRLALRVTNPGSTGDETDIQRLESDRQAVRIMTIHKSKGLEAAVVALFGGLWESPNRRHWATRHEEGRVVREVPARGTGSSGIDPEEHDEWARLAYVALTRAKGRLYLPDCPLELLPNQQRRYQPIFDRLNAMKKSGELTGSIAVVNLPVDQIETVGQAPPFATATMSDAEQSLAAFEEKELDATSQHVYRLRARHESGVVTSYTRLHQQAIAGEEETKTQNWDFYRDDETDPPPPLLAEDLPAGAATGIFLHGVLERLPREELSSLTSFGDWWSLPAFTRQFAKPVLQRHGLEERHAIPLAQLVHAAMTQEYPLVEFRSGGAENFDVPSLPPLISLERVRHEMEFLLPYPDRGVPGLGRRWPDNVVAERGFLKGIVDLVFECDGRVYILDWKSNLLAGYTPPFLARVVAQEYQLQLQIYTLALARLLGVKESEAFSERFGGVFYVFLRGLEGRHHSRSGIFFVRPAWDDVLRYEAELRGHDPRFRSPRRATGGEQP